MSLRVQLSRRAGPPGRPAPCDQHHRCDQSMRRHQRDSRELALPAALAINSKVQPHPRRPTSPTSAQDRRNRGGDNAQRVYPRKRRRPLKSRYGYWDKAKALLRKHGHHVPWSVVEAAKVGVPQHRHRLLVVASRCASSCQVAARPARHNSAQQAPRARRCLIPLLPRQLEFLRQIR